MRVSLREHKNMPNVTRTTYAELVETKLILDGVGHWRRRHVVPVFAGVVFLLQERHTATPQGMNECTSEAKCISPTDGLTSFLRFRLLSAVGSTVGAASSLCSRGMTLFLRPLRQSTSGSCRCAAIDECVSTTYLSAISLR